jgi:hypothetical protein
MVDSALSTIRAAQDGDTGDELIASVYAQIKEHIDKNDVRPIDLALRMHKTKPYVTQLLRCPQNYTLRTISELCDAIGLKPDFHIHANNQMGGNADE